MRVAGPMRLIQVVKQLSMGESQLLKWNRHGVLSAFSFTDSSSSCCDRAWQEEPRILGRSTEGTQTEVERDLPLQVSPLILAMVSQPHHIYYITQPVLLANMMEK